MREIYFIRLHYFKFSNNSVTSIQYILSIIYNKNILYEIMLYIYILVKNSSKCKHSNIFVLLYIDNFQDNFLI